MGKTSQEATAGTESMVGYEGHLPATQSGWAGRSRPTISAAVSAGLTGAALLVATAAPAAAAGAGQFSYGELALNCDARDPGQPPTSLAFDAIGPNYAEIYFAAFGGDLADASPTWASTGEGAESWSYQNQTLTVTFTVVSAEGVVGQATAVAALDQGPPEPDVWGVGPGWKGWTDNKTWLTRAFRQSLTADAISVALPGGAQIQFGSCSGSRTTYSTLISSPHAAVERQNRTVVQCQLRDGDVTGKLTIFDNNHTPDGDGYDIEYEAHWPDGYFLGYSDSISLFVRDALRDGFHAEFDLHGFWDPPHELDVDFSGEGVPEQYQLRSGSFSLAARGTAYPAFGTLRVPSARHGQWHDATFDLSGCYLEDIETVYQFNEPSNADSTGPAPVNDEPAGARALSTGQRIQQQTGSAAEGLEAPLGCVHDQGTRTVWFTVRPSRSGPMTVDTAGTGFDTVVGIYTGRPDDLSGVPGGCVDDVPGLPAGTTALSLQASVTVDAEAGTTYWVQVGGTTADRNWGLLKVAVS